MVKEVKLSAKDQTLIDGLSFNRESKIKQSISNPWTNRKCDLDARGVALYDYIKGCEALRLYDKQQQGLTLFRKLYPNEYMTLLD